MKKRWKSEGAISGLYGGLKINTHLNFMITSCVFIFVCGNVFMLKEDFSKLL